MLSSDRGEIAERWRDCAHISRKEIFGFADEKCAPKHLLDDAATMFVGYVGASYQPGVGVVLLAINPGGGGDTYESRTVEDQMFYPLLMNAKKAAGPSEVLESFERVNMAFIHVVKRWNLWRILKPTLEAAGTMINEIAYMNIVPYRTRNNNKPPVVATERSWKRIVEPSLDLLAPRAIVALGKKAGGHVNRWYAGDRPTYCVPRTIGDSWVCDEAKAVHERMKSELRSH